MSQKEPPYTLLPSVQECLGHLLAHETTCTIPYNRLKHCSRLFLDQLRQDIRRKVLEPQILGDKYNVISALVSFTCRYHRPCFLRVINATGIIVHTNLGRSLLPLECAGVLETAGLRYSNLEFDLASGQRGSRYTIVNQLLCELTGAEA